MKIRYVFEDGNYSIYRLEDIELGLFKANISQLKSGNTKVIRRDRYTEIEDKNNREIYENDIITYDGNSSGEVKFKNGAFYVNNELLSNLSDIVIGDRMI